MIFKRAVASQMAPARYDSTVMIFDVAGERFRAAGRVLIFDGFLKVYAEVDEEKEKKGEEDKLQLLPPVEVGELVPKVQEILEEKKSKPPGRFTLGSLVKELERLEIGRPSTYSGYHQMNKTIATAVIALSIMTGTEALTTGAMADAPTTPVAGQAFDYARTRA